MSAMASQITGVLMVCSTVCSGLDQRKHQSSASLAFVGRIHRWLVDSPHAENVPIWWRHYVCTKWYNILAVRYVRTKPHYFSYVFNLKADLSSSFRLNYLYIYNTINCPCTYRIECCWSGRIIIAFTWVLFQQYKSSIIWGHLGPSLYYQILLQWTRSISQWMSYFVSLVPGALKIMFNKHIQYHFLSNTLLTLNIWSIRNAMLQWPRWIGGKKEISAHL